MKKTIAQQLNITEFPFIIKNKNGNVIYFENSKWWFKREIDSKGNEIYLENSEGFWCKYEYDSNSKETYYVDSNGNIRGNRPKSCEGKIVEIDGIEYELKAVKK